MSSVLFPVFDPSGRSVGLQAEDGKVMCFFSRRVLAERWLIDMGLEEHIVGKALNAEELARYCDVAMADGFVYGIINPPLRLGRGMEMGTLLELKERAVARA